MREDGRTGTKGSAGEVFWAFLKLGLTSFGGPIAHLGYFRDELVTRRRWLDDQAYADLVALCQFLPGPASSQTGFALGLMRAGALGGLAAWAAFTLPSALLMVLFAAGAASLDGPAATGALHGLKLVAVAVVAQAVWGMARTLTPDRPRVAIGLLALFAVVVLPTWAGQVGAIGAGGLLGLWLCRGVVGTSGAAMPVRIGRRLGAIAFAACIGLLLGLPLSAAASGSHAVALADSFYRAGALVFGGGHVVLPLLEAETVARGWLSADTFLAGYGAAQAVPGPLFTFGAYLGAVSGFEPNGVVGAAIALVAVFLPGLLLVLAALPFWATLRSQPMARAGMAGANAAVVGVLGAALYDPVWTSAVMSPLDAALAASGFVALTVFRAAPGVVVVALAAIGALLGALA
ncbi:chromate efflux transporter [Devosia albogilva]|uniref:Chromate efflux transporter n=1 Tax=Devosia albogilva TaxID=429726 RepID=A0ABW5QNW9_9HYPH